MRIVLVIGVVTGGALLASCSSMSAYVADGLPEWAGGLPKGTPPRPGTPGYEAYVRELSGQQPTSAVPPAAAPSPPAAAPSPPPRTPREPVDEPVH
jgi:hypothetical protein